MFTGRRWVGGGAGAAAKSWPRRRWELPRRESVRRSARHVTRRPPPNRAARRTCQDRRAAWADAEGRDVCRGRWRARPSDRQPAEARAAGLARKWPRGQQQQQQLAAGHGATRAMHRGMCCVLRVAVPPAPCSLGTRRRRGTAAAPAPATRPPRARVVRRAVKAPAAGQPTRPCACNETRVAACAMCPLKRRASPATPNPRA